MTFTSFSYALFLPVVLALFYYVGDRQRPFLLLMVSLFFYATLGAPYLVVTLLFVALITHAVGQRLRHSELLDNQRRTIFWAGVCLNLSVLIFFRYAHNLVITFNFLNPALYGQISPIISGLLTFGVSYYVFQAISYLADIYLETIIPERSFLLTALYLSFFPKLLQGPIERAEALLPQLKKPYRFDYIMARSGLMLFVWGFFKKVVVADRFGILVDSVYGNLHDFSGITLIIATYCYAFQIYCDFSAYTDMAIGTARLFNIRLTQNFASPYLAASVADFWRRWHISFSNWILDYIFKPVQFSLRYWRTAGTVVALLITFFVSGLWHGASWGFVLWGMIHGVYLSAAILYRPYQKKLYRYLKLEGNMFAAWWKTLITFNLICLAWVFFRAATIQDGWYVITHMLVMHDSGLSSLIASVKKIDLAILCVTLPLMALLHAKGEEEALQKLLAEGTGWQRWSVYAGLTLTIILFRIDKGATFIYFQF